MHIAYNDANKGVKERRIKVHSNVSTMAHKTA